MIIRDRNREELAKNIRSAYPLAGDVHLQFGNCHILVQSNSEPVINGLKLYFSAFTTVPAAPDRLISVYQTLEWTQSVISSAPPNFFMSR